MFVFLARLGKSLYVSCNSSSPVAGSAANSFLDLIGKVQAEMVRLLFPDVRFQQSLTLGDKKIKLLIGNSRTRDYFAAIELI